MAVAVGRQLQCFVEFIRMCH